MRQVGSSIRMAAVVLATWASLAAACPDCPKGQAKGDVEQLLARADQHQRAGQYADAAEVLRQARDRAEDDPVQAVRVRNALGSSLTFLRQYDEAERELRAALTAAEDEAGERLIASVRNNLAVLMSARGEYEPAALAFRAAQEHAEAAGDEALAASAAVNHALAVSHVPEEAMERAATTHEPQPGPTTRVPDSIGRARLPVDAARTAVDRAEAAVAALPESARKASMLVALARVHERLRGRGGQPDRIATHLTRAAELAQANHDPLTASYAYGHLAATEERSGRADMALRLTRKAAFYAQQAQSPDATYRWQWQTGRLLRAKGDLDGALRSYANAVAALQTIREDVALGYGNRLDAGGFRETAGPIYFELADLLLRKASTIDDPVEQRARLLEARSAVELFKNFELADYFQDPCIDTARARQVSIDAVAAKTAVVYLIPLADRTELLVTTAGELRRFTVDVKGDVLNEEVHLFRRRLQDRTTERYLTQARKIHDWIIAPIEPHLTSAGVETLVFVPDGALRGIPMGALQDPKSKTFLIERYAVAITPGLTLMDDSPLPRGRVELLVTGLAESRHGLPALQFVPRELEQIQGVFGGTKLLDEKFVAPALKQQVSAEPYTIVHIASHGEFKSDVRDTFLATWDRKLTLDELQQMLWPNLSKNRPVELLALSACQTAAGDDRAALGLAGVAIKSGARAALATLWSVNDEASAEVVGSFYRNLRDQPAMNKAQALRDAQLRLLADDRYQHPCYWSPYLIIGNWL